MEPQDLDRARNLYGIYRSQVEHEDNLVGQRSSWVLLAQSFLVVGYCILHQLKPPEASAQPLYLFVANGLAYLAFAVVIPILLSIVGGLRAIQELESRFEALRRETPALEHLLTTYPPLHARGLNTRFGNLPVVAVPLLFLAFWGLMIVLQFRHGHLVQ